jgi:hypothetical protein
VSKEPDDQDRDDLARLGKYTSMIRTHQHHVDQLSQKRADLVMDLRDRGIPVRFIAEGTGISKQNVHAIIAKARSNR